MRYNIKEDLWEIVLGGMVMGKVQIRLTINGVPVKYICRDCPIGSIRRCHYCWSDTCEHHRTEIGDDDCETCVICFKCKHEEREDHVSPFGV